MGEVKLNLGAGDYPVPGYRNIDCRTGGQIYPDIIDPTAADFDGGGGFALASVDEIRASHVLEHFAVADVPRVLARWVEYLKPGGVLKIAVPDFEKIATWYLEGRDLPLQSYLMGSQNYPENFHRCVFDAEALEDALREAGLVDIRPWPGGGGDCSALPVSLNLRGAKPTEVPRFRVGCAMSVPRLGWMENFFCWAAALMPYGIRPTSFEGAFWDQCLDRVMVSLVEENDYILTVDYDSVFTRETVGNLLRLAAANPEADAIAALQIKRGDGTPLMVLHDADGKPRDKVTVGELQPDLVEVATAHFGLTLFRAKALEGLPRPWFRGVPDGAGGWGDGKVDPDIYFWQNWKANGRTLYVAPHVVIGHLELMVTWPDKRLAPLRQLTSDFRKRGAPEGVWR